MSLRFSRLRERCRQASDPISLERAVTMSRRCELCEFAWQLGKRHWQVLPTPSPSRMSGLPVGTSPYLYQSCFLLMAPGDRNAKQRPKAEPAIRSLYYNIENYPLCVENHTASDYHSTVSPEWV